MSSFTTTSQFIFISCLLNLAAADSVVYGYSFGGAAGLVSICV